MPLLPCPTCAGLGTIKLPTEDGREMRRSRERAAISQAELARDIGISRGYLCDLEHGRRRWTAEIRARTVAAIKAYMEHRP